MKNLLLIVLMSVAFTSCDLFKKPEEEAPAKTPGVCLGAEEAVAQGFKACKAPGCLCVKDDHGGVVNDVPHCHSSAALCDFN